MIEEQEETHVIATGQGQSIHGTEAGLAAPSLCLCFPFPPCIHLAALNSRLFLESAEYKLWGFP